MAKYGSRRKQVLTGLAVVVLMAMLFSVVSATSPFPPATGAPGDEAAASCDRLHTLAINETVAPDATEADWFKFTVEKDARYTLEVKNSAGLGLTLHGGCSESAPALELPDGQLEFTATRDDAYYLLVKADGVPSDYQVTLSPAAPHRANSAALADVPEALQRRAVEFLEQLRNSGLAPEWQDARLDLEPRILYRPDMEDPAYYEFTVEKPTDTGWESAGFIQLATGDHDYVLTHWDMTGMSPTEELGNLAPLGARLTEFYKLNSLAYVAEYEEVTALGLAIPAEEIVNLGDIPGRIEGLDAIPKEPAEMVNESVDSEGNEEYDGPDELPLLVETGWESWGALKDGYEEAFAPLLESLKERANDEWVLEKSLEEHGESLIKGDVRTVYGLPSQTLDTIDVTGEGATSQYLRQQQLSDEGTLTGVRLTVLDEPADEDGYLPINVNLTYTSGMSETVKYAIVNASALNIYDIYLPMTAGGGGGMVSGASAENDAAVGGWGPWHYYWADGHAHGETDSIKYGQFSYLGCASGCGATAWATIFGWVDRRSAVSAHPWTPHWGTYRVNGGLGANAVAPRNQNEGVRNMTREIRNHIGTYCCGSGGCTAVTTMINAYRYIQPRATAAWQMRTRYDPTGLCWFGSCNPAREMARWAIITKRQPAILAANNHYPIAHGYAWRKKRSCFLWICSTDYSRWFYVNNGWYGNNNGWVNWDDVFFAGIYEDR